MGKSHSLRGKLAALLLAFGGLPLSALAAGNFSLSSPDVSDGGTIAAAQVYSHYGCGGRNVSPALEWHGAPADTRSYAVTVFDPDARAGKGWWHWLIFNIPADARSLPADAGDIGAAVAPEGSMQSVSNFDEPGYGGPCPPKGEPPHHYVFTIYALNVEHLPLTPTSHPDDVRDALEAHALGKASFTALYGR
jgi:hypothetical protein